MFRRSTSGSPRTSTGSRPARSSRKCTETLPHLLGDVREFGEVRPTLPAAGSVACVVSPAAPCACDCTSAGAAACASATTFASASPCGTVHGYCATVCAWLYCALAGSVGATLYCVNADCMISDHTGAADAPPNWNAALGASSTTIAAKRG